MLEHSFTTNIQYASAFALGEKTFLTLVLQHTESVELPEQSMGNSECANPLFQTTNAPAWKVR